MKVERLGIRGWRWTSNDAEVARNEIDLNERIDRTVEAASDVSKRLIILL
jgi:hypothetical protein